MQNIEMKTFAILCFLATIIYVLAQDGYGNHQHHHHEEHYIDYQSHPHYQYKYGVHDEKTHDIKEQHEERDGHKTKGMYSFKQPDGRTRIVEYEADKHGINYKVSYKGHAIHQHGHHYESHHGGHSSN